MKVAIAGNGVTGAYLYRLLKAEGFAPDFYGIPHETMCGISPCGWGTSVGFKEHLDEIGLDANDYIIENFNHMFLHDIRVKAEFYTIDKPKLLRALSENVEVKYTPLNPSTYDRVVDATGVARAYLPAIREDLLMRCVQFMVRAGEPREICVKIGGAGYAWYFPMGDVAHVGYGCIRGRPESHINGSSLAGWSINNPICSCCGEVRVSAPSASQPIIIKGHPQIAGVGEAVGCVSPLVADGIVHGMRSVKILLDNWDDLEGYSEELLHEFAWFDKERRIVDKMAAKQPLSILDGKVLMDNSQRRMGIRMGLFDALRMSKRYKLASTYWSLLHHSYNLW